MIPRHDPYLAAPSRFYGQRPPRRDGFCIVAPVTTRLLRVFLPLTPRHRGRNCPPHNTVAIKFITGPLKGPVLLPRPTRATCTPIYRIRERRRVIAFGLILCRNGGEIYRRGARRYRPVKRPEGDPYAPPACRNVWLSRQPRAFNNQIGEMRRNN